MLVGITGTKGAGKGELSKLLQERGFELFSMGDLVRKEAKERGIELTKENLQKLGMLLSKEEGQNFVVRRIISKVEKDKNYVIEGFRFVEDIIPFKKRKDFSLIGITATLEVRWKRVESRKRADDNIVSFEEFKKYDAIENTSIKGQNVMECLKMADFRIVNDGSLEELDEKLTSILEKIKC